MGPTPEEVKINAELIKKARQQSKKQAQLMPLGISMPNTPPGLVLKHYIDMMDDMPDHQCPNPEDVKASLWIGGIALAVSLVALATALTALFV